MRFALIALISAVVALAQPTTEGPYPFNPPNVSPNFHGWNTAAPAVKRAPVTNAERFAQGLSPLKPKARRHRGGPHRDSSYLTPGTRVRSAPRAETSPTPPVTTTCLISVADANGNKLGYVSPTWNEFGEYGSVQDGPDGALMCSLVYQPDSPSQLNMFANNGPDASWPYVGGILGFSAEDDSSFGQGKFNYAYLVGTETAPAGPPTTLDSSYGYASGLDSAGESAIWTYNPDSREITAQWINPDKSSVIAEIVSTSGVLALTGDHQAMSASLDIPVDVVHLMCVPVATPV